VTPYPEENPDSLPKALLGKILFWDEQLSADNAVACGTCHRPSAGGSDPRSALATALAEGPDGLLGTDDDVRGSHGVIRCNAEGQQTGADVQLTGRKAPTYLDAMFAPRLFWDGRAECRGADCPSPTAFRDPDNPASFAILRGAALENQALGPPMSPVEMACEEASWSAIHEKLAEATPLALARDMPTDVALFIATHGASYPRLFEAAFGDEQTSGARDEINTRRIAFAIATHERRLRSDQTPWDRWNAGDDTALTPAQLRGFEVLMGAARCNACHREPLFSDGDFHFIGFHEPAWDNGREAVTSDPLHRGAMRTPTLRNVALRESGGLLHRGAGPGASLERILELYVQGGLRDDPEIAAVPIAAAMRPLELSERQIADLLDFIKIGLTDPRVALEQPPFDRPKLSTE
jgi:cytochrome c peroxidase